MKKKITAKMLRDIGVDVHCAIPDRAYIFSDEMYVGSHGCGIGTEDFEEGKRNFADATIRQNEYWRWE